MNKGTKKKWNNGQRRKSRNPVRDYKFPKLDWIKN